MSQPAFKISARTIGQCTWKYPLPLFASVTCSPPTLVEVTGRSSRMSCVCTASVSTWEVSSCLSVDCTSTLHNHSSATQCACGKLILTLTLILPLSLTLNIARTLVPTSAHSLVPRSTCKPHPVALTCVACSFSMHVLVPGDHHGHAGFLR